MKIEHNVAKTVDRRIDTAYQAEREYCFEKVQAHRTKIYEQIEAIQAKPLTKAGIAIVNAHLANNEITGRMDVTTDADKKRITALRKKHDGYQTTQWRRRDKVELQLCKLKEAIGADLELCNNANEQRAVLARFKTHPLDKAWDIPKAPHKEAAPEVAKD